MVCGGPWGGCSGGVSACMLQIIEGLHMLPTGQYTVQCIWYMCEGLGTEYINLIRCVWMRQVLLYSSSDGNTTVYFDRICGCVHQPLYICQCVEAYMQCYCMYLLRWSSNPQLRRIGRREKRPATELQLGTYTLLRSVSHELLVPVKILCPQSPFSTSHGLLLKTRTSRLVLCAMWW